MSTKTTFKRIALVAVAALGFGVLTSVAPASAVGANDNITAIAAGTSAPARVGVVSGATTITLTHPETATPAYSETVTAQITSAPATSVNAALSFAVSSSKPMTSATYTPSTKTDWTSASMAGIASAFGVIAVSSKSTNVSLRLNADVAGSYTILVTANANAGGGFTAGKISTTYTITTAGAPASITAASYGGSVTTSGQYGQLFSFTLKDAAGNATVLGTNESIDIADNSTAVSVKDDGKAVGNVLTSWGPAGSNSGTPVNHSSGKYYFRVVNDGTAIAADGTAIITLTGGGLLPSTLTTNVSATLKAATAATGTPVAACTTAANCVSFATTGAQSITWTGLTSGSTTAAVVHATELKDGSGYLYNSTATIAAATTAATKVAATAPAVSATMTEANVTIKLLTALGGTGVAATLTYGAPAAASIAVLGTANVLSATAGSTTWNVEVDNQYGGAVQYAPVSVSVSGRNTVASTSIGVTDANGIISYTLKDAGTTGTKDTIIFTTGSYTATATVTYGTVTVSKVSFTGGSTTAGVTAATATTNPISAGDTPEGSAVGASVTVTDASGNLLAGVPVVFSVASADAAKLAIVTNKVTVYTGADGKAASSVFAWIAGTYTVTATAGGVTGTGSYTFANSNAADARVLSATSADGIITAKVVDRFGNPVSGVVVYASRTSGTGYFGTGVSKTSTTTGVDGTAEFTLVGTADVKVSTLSYDAVAGTNAPGQTCALAGNLTCAVGTTAATAFTATTAGTAAVAAANVGSSFAPAGV
ncbi:MAG: hypothetical protein EBU08_08045, partial [Micrococcales bacterium]|nr:hypothetical protein [Micrococcales bacterium]